VFGTLTYAPLFPLCWRMPSLGVPLYIASAGPVTVTVLVVALPYPVPAESLTVIDAVPGPTTETCVDTFVTVGRMLIVEDAGCSTPGSLELTLTTSGSSG